GKLLAAASPGKIWLVDPTAPKNKPHLLSLDNEARTVRGLMFTRDGKALVVLTDRDVLHLVDVATGKRLRAFEPKEPVGAFALSAKGQQLVAISGAGERLMYAWQPLGGLEQ